MNRKLLVWIFPLLLLAFASAANAQTVTTGSAETKNKTPQAKKEEFRTRLQTIKDQRKKIVVERLDAKIANINVKHTERFTVVLNNLQIILDKINAGLDKTQAQEAIDAAMSAVETQTAKTYTIEILTESALKESVGSTISQLRQDLKTTYKLVVDAKQEVQKLRENLE